jgi:hypothetical protein
MPVIPATMAALWVTPPTTSRRSVSQLNGTSAAARAAAPLARQPPRRVLRDPNRSTTAPENVPDAARPALTLTPKSPAPDELSARSALR